MSARLLSASFPHNYLTLVCSYWCIEGTASCYTKVCDKILEELVNLGLYFYEVLYHEVYILAFLASKHDLFDRVKKTISEIQN